MNPNTEEYANDIKLDKSGRVDVEYYQARALAMRAECTAEMIQFAINRIKALTASIIDRMIGLRSQPTH